MTSRGLRYLVVCAVGVGAACKHSRSIDERAGDRDRDREYAYRRPSRPSSTASRREIAEIAARETRRETARSVPGAAWTSLGPAAGNTIDHTGVLTDAESGLVEAMRTDPRDPRIVYVATAGGGIWKTPDITADVPSWQPISDRLGNLAIGGFDLDPQHPDTIVVGLGEPFYQQGGFVQTSVDGGTSWGDPVTLGAATNVRDLKIDPTDSQVIFVATDVGLFRSDDGGRHFALLDLPNGVLTLQEATWSLAYTGHDASGSHWSVSGVQACDVGLTPPQSSGGLPPGAACPHGNAGDIWRSLDGGATWTSAKAANALPPSVSRAGLVATQGRMTIAAGDSSDPAHTVVYAMVGNRDESHAETINMFRSLDGGATWTSAKGTLTNPDTVCTDLDVGSSQSGFNQAIAVDPSDGDRVVVAGLYCSVRTLNGRSATPTWQVISDVYGGQTSTSCGPIPYVHSDFHAAVIAQTAGGSRLILGGDGGVETSTEALTATTGTECSITWQNANYGLVTHLCYSIASGDALGGDPEVIFTGMQDLSSRWRDPAHPDHWNTINLSDGTGGAVAHAGNQSIYWSAQASDTLDRAFCRHVAGVDCGLLESWRASNPTLPAGDSEPFLTYLAAIDSDAGGGVLSHTTFNVWRADATPAWTNITGRQCEPDGTCSTGNLAYSVNTVAASTATAGLFGAAMYDHTAVTSDGGATWAIPSPLGIGGRLLAGAPSSIALPAVPPAGTTPGDVYIAGTSSELMADGSVVPAAIGHLFITHDRGRTWRPLSGSGASTLPNVPVWTVKYDRTDPDTIYTATEIGVYQTSDGGQSWTRFGMGLPMVRTTDIMIAHDNSVLRISTWGRGVWQLALTDSGKGDGEDGSPSPSAGGCGCGAGGPPPVSLGVSLLVAAMLRGRRRPTIRRVTGASRPRAPAGSPRARALR